MSTELSRYHPPLFLPSIINDEAHDDESEMIAFFTSSDVVSENIAISIYPILPESIRESIEGTMTVSRISVTSLFLSLPTLSIVKVTFDPFGHRILSTASEAEIPTIDSLFTWVIISPFRSLLISAGDQESTFII